MGTLQEERNRLFLDIYSGKKPARVPFMTMIDIQAALEYLGYSVKRDFYSAQKCYEAADKMAELVDIDTLATNPGSMPGAAYRYLGYKLMVPGEEGFFQHPNISLMEFDEYEQYIKDPYEFIVGTLRPRVFEVFNEEYPELAFIKIRIARQVVANEYAGMAPKLMEKHQRVNVQGMVGYSFAPFDYIANNIRSFTTVLTDMKRSPQLVLDALEATTNFEIQMIKAFSKPPPGILPIVQVPLHMAPYMSSKDVEKFYWPTFVKIIQALVDHGFIPSIFFEADWERHMYLLPGLPKGVISTSFENVKRESIKKYLPSWAVLTRAFPFMLMKTGTKQECIDEVKRVIDDLAGDGKFIFGPNKGMLRAGDINMENVQAIIQTVKEYGKY